MALTAQETAELAAEAFAVDLRVFIGGRRNDWDGAEDDMRWNQAPPTYLYAQTTLATSIGNTWDYSIATGASIARPDTLVLTDASSFRSGGGYIFVGPGASDEIWERATFSGVDGNTLTGVTWERQNARSQVSHTAGATVAMYYEVTDYLSGNISLESYQQSQWYRWRAYVPLHGLDSRLVERDHSVVVLRRKWVNGSWTSWALWFFGYVSDVQQAKDWKDNPDITLRVEGLSQYMQYTTCDPITSMQHNLALNKSVTASSTISDPNLDTNSDDWLGKVPASVDASNVVDGDINTVWISSSEPNNITYEEEDGHGNIIDEVFAWPWTGYSDGLQWFRIWIRQGTLIGDLRIFNEQTTGGYDNPTGYFLDLQDYASDTVVAGQRFILCNNRTMFEEYFDAGDATVIEWTTLRGSSRNADQFVLGKSSGFLILKAKHWGTNDGVIWGTATYPGGFTWSGGNVPAPSNGYSIRRSPPGVETNTAADWVPEDIVNPGEWRGRPDDSSFTGEWISVDLGALNLTLGQALTNDANDPADGKIEIRRGDTATTDGLINSGTIQIGTEQISYTGRTSTHITGITRGANSTTIAAHAVGDTVYQVVDGTAVDAWPIIAVRLLRKHGLNPKIYNGRVYTSTMSGPRRPGSGAGWENDWSTPRHITRNVWPRRTVRYNTPVWARHVMVIFDDMANYVGTLQFATEPGDTTIYVKPGRWWSKMPSSGTLVIEGDRATYTGKGTDTITGILGLSESHPAEARVMVMGGRAKLNELEVERYMVDLENEEDLDDSTAPTLLQYILVNRFGVRSWNVTVPSDDLPPVEPTYTAKGPYLAVTDELARKYGLVIVEQLDSTIDIQIDPWYPGGEPSDMDYTWDRDNSVTTTFGEPFNKEVSQVEVVVRDTDQNETGTFRYPPKPWRYGSVRRIGEIVAHLSNGQLLAEREFMRIRANRTWNVEPVGIADSVWGNQLHKVDWTGFEGLGLVVGAQWTVGPETYDCSIYLREYRP